MNNNTKPKRPKRPGITTRQTVTPIKKTSHIDTVEMSNKTLDVKPHIETTPKPITKPVSVETTTSSAPVMDTGVTVVDKEVVKDITLDIEKEVMNDGVITQTPEEAQDNNAVEVIEEAANMETPEESSLPPKIDTPVLIVNEIEPKTKEEVVDDLIQPVKEDSEEKEEIPTVKKQFKLGKSSPKLKPSSKHNNKYIMVSSLSAEEASDMAMEWVELLGKQKDMQNRYDELKDKTPENIKLLEDEFDLKMNEVDFGSGNVEARDSCFSTENLYTDKPFIREREEIEIFKPKKINKTKITNNPDAYFSSIMGLGQPTETRFINSGFCITFRYPTKSEQRAFADAIEDGEHGLGFNFHRVNTNSVEYVKIVKLVYDLAKKLVISSTLNTSDPLQYVLHSDLEILVLSIISNIYPKGLPIQMPCVATTMIKDGKAKCENVIKGLLDPLELVYIDKDKIDPLAFNLSAKVDKGCIEVEEILPIYESMDILSMKIEAEDEITISFFDDYITGYIDMSMLVLEYIEQRALEGIAIDGKRDIDKMVASLNFDPIKFNIMVSSINVNGLVFDDPFKNISILDIILQTEDGMDAFSKLVDEARENKSIRIGIPAYNCGCGTFNGVEGLRPINPIQLLVEAVQLRLL